MIKRALPIAGVFGLLSVALAGTAAAGGGGGYGGRGHFQFSDTTAYATFGVRPATIRPASISIAAS